MNRVMRKPTFCLCENKDADQLSGNREADHTAKLISPFVFATWKVQSLYFQNPNFQASCHLLWLHSLVCVDQVGNQNVGFLMTRLKYLSLYLLSSLELSKLCYSSCVLIEQHHNKSKCMQRSGTEAIKTQIQPSKPKWEITNITKSQNTKRTCGQPNEQLFPKRWPLSNRNRTKNMNTH